MYDVLDAKAAVRTNTCAIAPLSAIDIRMKWIQAERIFFQVFAFSAMLAVLILLHFLYKNNYFDGLRACAVFMSSGSHLPSEVYNRFANILWHP